MIKNRRITRFCKELRAIYDDSFKRIIDRECAADGISREEYEQGLKETEEYITATYYSKDGYLKPRPVRNPDIPQGLKE